MNRAHSPQTATTRSVPLRKRPDLAVSQQCFAHRRYWVLKDPVSLRYARLSEQEYAIWQMLDGRASLEDIKRDFEKQFAPFQLTYQQLQGFLGDLHRKGLVVAGVAGQGEQLFRRDRQRRGRELRQTLAGVLAIRFRGVNPDPLLGWLHSICHPLFSRWAVGGTMLLALVAIALVAVQFDVLRARLPDFRAFFGATNIAWIALALAATKILHELGHGLACKHFGGRCHELGMMFLVFVPCLYCNVSDAWMLPNKWHRVAITAAGVWVEVTLASVCTILWWFSEPGLLNTLCLNTMFVCSVSTLLFNGNPLLRYDGYYVLSDLVETPNLWQQSRDYLRSLARRCCLGVEQYEDLAWLHLRRGWLALYGVASTVYRWAVLAGIVLFLFEVLRPRRLQVLAQSIMAVVIVGILAVPMSQGWQFARNPSNRRRIRPGRFATTCLVLLALGAALCCLPVPFSVTAPAILEPEDADRVYVTVAGELAVVNVKPGDTVRKSDPLATLLDIELTREVKRLEGDLLQQQTRLDSLQARRSMDPDTSVQIPAAQKMLDDIRRRLKKSRREHDKLALAAPSPGMVLPPPHVPDQSSETGRLSPWSGTPLDETNHGCFLETGTLLCMIGNPNRLEAVVYVDQADVQFVSTGQRVRLRLDTLPGRVIEGVIAEVAKKDARVAPRELATDDLPVRVGPDGIARPIQAAYQARVSLDTHDFRLPIGSRGTAKIVAAPQSLGRRLYRYLSRTFTFRL